MRWGRWGLYIGGGGIVELLGYYGSAFAAADSYMRSTGVDFGAAKRNDLCLTRELIRVDLAAATEQASWEPCEILLRPSLVA
jgi:hypothetical protein